MEFTVYAFVLIQDLKTIEHAQTHTEKKNVSFMKLNFIKICSVSYYIKLLSSCIQQTSGDNFKGISTWCDFIYNTI